MRKWKVKPSCGTSGGSVVKNPAAMQEAQVRALDQEDALEEGVATHSSMLAWKIPSHGQEPGGLQSKGSQPDSTERLSPAHVHLTRAAGVECIGSVTASPLTCLYFRGALTHLFPTWKTGL